MREVPLVRVDGVSKKFCRSLKRSLWYGARDLFGETLAQSGQNRLRLRREEFLAVDDVSFEVHRGQCLGLIGPNGAGKSTLLKMLNGLVRPDAGRISIRGRVGALIELGAGFNPLLTGRENVYVNAAVLGLKRREFEEKFDRIVDFAQLGDFIDAPVQSYSSGMRVRLGFAVAAHVDPDVLLIDEVLAVGDAAFRARCYRRIWELRNRAALLFVSHDMSAVARVCTSALVLERGVGRAFDQTAAALQAYMRTQTVEQAQVTEDPDFHVSAFDISGGEADSTIRIETGAPVDLRIVAATTIEPPPKLRVSITVLGPGLDPVAQAARELEMPALVSMDREFELAVRVHSLSLNPGPYYLTLLIDSAPDRRILAWHHCAARFEVRGDRRLGAPVELAAEWIMKRPAEVSAR